MQQSAAAYCRILMALLCLTQACDSANDLSSGGGLLARCTHDNDCGSGLLCALERCHKACDDDDECKATEQCRLVGEARVCASEDEPEPDDAQVEGDARAGDGSSETTDAADEDGGLEDIPDATAEAGDGSSETTDASDKDGGLEDIPDATAPTDSGDSSPDAASDGAGGGALANGAACLADNHCASGHCAPKDAVCCDIACQDKCLGCLKSKTGYADGTCGPILQNTDPDAECTAQGAASCGADGSGCNGNAVAPGCRLYVDGTQCAPQACSAGAVTPARFCDGRGSCRPQVSTSCGAYRCNGDSTACLASCSGDGDCIASYECESNHTCALQNTGAEVLWITKWEAQFELDGRDSNPGSIISDSAGRAIFSTNCQGIIPGLTCSPVGTGGEAVYRLGANGQGLWSQGLGFRSFAPSMAIGASDAIVAGANANWSGGCCTAALHAYGASGEPQWSRPFSTQSGGGVPLRWLTTDGSGNTLAHFEYPAQRFGFDGVDYGGGLVTGSVLVKYNAAGLLVWTRSWPSGNGLASSSDQLVSDPSGNLIGVVAESAVDWGCSSGATTGLRVLKTNAAGDCTWLRSFGAAPVQSSLALDGAGNIFIAAIVSGAVNFGSGLLSPIGTRDIVLARLAPDGTEVWSHRYSGTAFDGSASLSVTPNGQLLLGGQFAGSVDFGGGALLAAAGSSYLAKFSFGGVLVGQHQFKGSFKLAADPNGDALILSPDKALDLGAGPVFTTAGVAVAKLRL